MILGQISDVARQKGILPAAIVRALEALQKVNPGTMEPGRYELEGDKLFYLVQDVELRTMGESKPEAHHKYADIQIPLSTSERYGFSLPQADLAVVDDQLEAKDLAFYAAPANESFMDLNPGAYVVFLPKELHRPCLAIKDKATIRKVVIKVHASLLGL
jgi:biofilm protein TabA